MITDIAELAQVLANRVNKQVPEVVDLIMTPEELRATIEMLQLLAQDDKGISTALLGGKIGPSVAIHQCCETTLEQVSKVGSGSEDAKEKEDKS